jgi:hypothetical protein
VYEPFHNNQKLFLDGLIKNCLLERKQPEPAPILEVEEQAEDIPFVPRLLERRVFRENRNDDSFTIDEARRVIYINRRFMGNPVWTRRGTGSPQLPSADHPSAVDHPFGSSRDAVETQRDLDEAIAGDDDHDDCGHDESVCDTFDDHLTYG